MAVHEKQQIQFATFWIQELLFGIRVAEVQEVLLDQPMTPIPLAPRAVLGLLNLRGQIATAVDLPAMLSQMQEPDDGSGKNVIVRLDLELVSLRVGRIGGVIEVLPTQARPHADGIQGPVKDLIAGMYELGGTVMLWLDTEAAVKIAWGEAHAS